MISRTADFDTWMDAAEINAVRMDAAQIARLHVECTTWIAYFAAGSTPIADLQHAQKRLHRYRDLVQLLHRSLCTALHQAANPHGAGYGPAADNALPAVLGRYG